MTTENKSAPAPEMPKKITIGDKYRPAMEITDLAEANDYFERCVKHSMIHFGKSRSEAETLERTNLGYFAGYYDDKTRARVEMLFKCAHPIFGKFAENGSPSFADAFIAGVRAASDV